MEVIDKQYGVLFNKLDIVIRLLAIVAISDKKSQQEQFVILNRVGLQPKDIAEMLGTTPNTVRVGLSSMRKKKGRR